MGIALDHKKRIQVERANAVACEKAMANEIAKQQNLNDANKTFNALLANLDVALKRISGLPKGIERTNLKKNQLLPEFMPKVLEYLDGDDEFKNPVLVQCMIWSYDVGNIKDFWWLAENYLKQHQEMPDRYLSNTHTFVADSVLEYSNNAVANGEEFEPYFSNVFESLKDWPVPDAVKEKYNFFYGERLKEKADKLVTEGKYQDALKILHHLAQNKFKVKGKIAEASKAFGEELFEAGEYKKALRLFNVADKNGIKCKKRIAECEKFKDQN
ncbi:phage terminase small subunit [Lentisphaerota bacterium WC36G]|nr:hypothetical protein LJT99_00070 [Lentisphaerae bacterium WC36]